jgi:hypothetical protein
MHGKALRLDRLGLLAHSSEGEAERSSIKDERNRRSDGEGCVSERRLRKSAGPRKGDRKERGWEGWKGSIRGGVLTRGSASR